MERNRLAMGVWCLYCGVAIAADGAASPTVERAKVAVQEQLKDPESARFKNVVERAGQKTRVVCGEVNAKNSMGGYVGFRRFVASSLIGDEDGPVVHIEGIDPEQLFSVVLKRCNDPK